MRTSKLFAAMTASLLLLAGCSAPAKEHIKAPVEPVTNDIPELTITGAEMNANEWYQAFDCFVLPSIWEGLPVVGVEAQVADLPCIFSASITREIDLLENNEFISTQDSIEKWVNAITKAKEHTSRRDNTDIITADHYNIRTEALKLQERYLKLYGE